ncbi:MAG: UDP-N-acetylmuramoyl-L-alanyl-D-glutamate--2,6-diaminopimelate ligase [Crocinitomicaceae bacterium]|jgi:UDP-N-acetylmuramoyl-L-alanyl-D-glutamate--2,6-diaminopimelate ligase|nr:UDP-N-acetylmuramoyl-L-alanyl-D-glutamate--2,6-diaminopimelate ligase [Crocinitomicaceae bacterium]
MKHLHDILKGVDYELVSGTTEHEVSELVFDSRKATASTVFFAIRGTQVDGHSFISQVIEQGCSIIVCEETIANDSVTQIKVENSSRALGEMASNFFGNPSSRLSLIGITGTNGKTTTTTLLHQMFMRLGYETGLLSTVENKIGNTVIPSTHTTPNPVELNRLLAEMVDEGCAFCFMEVSSHAVVQHRIAGLEFKGGVFTNITHDHLDYHGTFAEYIKAKKAFFDSLGSDAFALTNSDDKNGMVMLQNTKAQKQTYALKTPSDFKAKVIENQFSGLVLNINGTELWTRLIGDFNAYNLLAVYGVSMLLEQDKMEVLTIMSQLESVSGRFQFIRSKSGITAIVDYAHTPDALENVLKTISNIRTRNETVYTIVGCGGDRDKTKRPKMAAIACELSDKVIITSDNPRSEDPAVIIEEMMSGVEGQYFKKTLSIQDREQAIKTAVSMAEENDIILVAGKGHETYQEIKGVKHDFDDLKIVKELFEKLDK